MLLDDIVSASSAIGHGDNPQADSYEQEPQDLIKEVAISQDQCSIIKGLLDRIVSRTDGSVIVGSLVKNREFLVKVAAEEW